MALRITQVIDLLEEIYTAQKLSTVAIYPQSAWPVRFLTFFVDKNVSKALFSMLSL